MKRIMLLVMAMLLIGSAFAITSNDISSKYDPDMDWFSAGEAENATIPDSLTEREAEIYREAFALGHYHALHPDHIEGMYVLNTRTKKFHYSDCPNTFLIDIPNREHTTKTKDELITEGYSPCGSCKP